MGNNVLEPSRWGSTEADSVIAPISLQAVVDAVQAPKKLMWWYVSPLAFGYNPFLIKANGWTTSGNLRFQFMNHEDGTVLAGEHEIDLNDRDLVHRESPSTAIPSSIDPANPVVVLMLNHQEMSSALHQAAINSKAWPDLSTQLVGKWPETALDTVLDLVFQLKARSTDTSLRGDLDDVIKRIMVIRDKTPSSRE